MCVKEFGTRQNMSIKAGRSPAICEYFVGLREYEVRAIRRYHKTSRIETGIARVRSTKQSVGIIKHHELKPGLREYEVGRNP